MLTLCRAGPPEACDGQGVTHLLLFPRPGPCRLGGRGLLAQQMWRRAWSAAPAECSLVLCRSAPDYCHACRPGRSPCPLRWRRRWLQWGFCRKLCTRTNQRSGTMAVMENMEMIHKDKQIVSACLDMLCCVDQEFNRKQAQRSGSWVWQQRQCGIGIITIQYQVECMP